MRRSLPFQVVITSININGNLLLIRSLQKDKGTEELMTALLLGWSNKYPENLEKAAELSISSMQVMVVSKDTELTSVNDIKSLLVQGYKLHELRKDCEIQRLGKLRSFCCRFEICEDGEAARRY